MSAPTTDIVLPAWVAVDPASSMAVSAGAGSGKTTSLVGRVAALVATPGVQPSDLVVITFTEKAAREVSHRLRESLGGSVALDEGFIGTIHGFCQSLLRRYPIEAGLPPKFTTADELTSGALADERAEQVVQQLYNQAAKTPAIKEALMVMASFGAISFLPELVRAIDNDWLRFASAVPARPISTAVAHSMVMRMLEGVYGDDRYVTASALMRSRLDAAVTDAKATLEFVDSIPALSHACTALDRRLRGGGKTAAWHPFEEAMRYGCYEPALARLMSALTPIVVDAANDRVSRGELSFDDLLLLTRRLLQTRADIRRLVRARHRHLFVDEFQDTDQVQFDVLVALTAPDADSPPSSMFAVGDPKQSIYGFRRADVELFSSLLAADPTSQQLTVNRRTRADVCQWINAVLGHRFQNPGHAAEAEHQVDYAPLEPQRSANTAADGPGVVVLGMPGWSKSDHDTAEDTARAEAADIAALAQRVVGPDPWFVSDVHGERPASYRDITVLIRSRTRLGVLEHTLRQAGVPYRVEGGTLIYGSREVYELLRVLRAVDDPTSQLKVVTALRTSLFGISDRQLMEYRLGPGDVPRPFRQDFRVYTNDHGIVGDALRVLDQMGRRKHERTPAELLAELYDGWRGVAAALSEGEQVARETWRRVRYVIDEARAWSDATGGTLAEYLAWVDRRVEDVDRVELSTDEGEDSVRIMTIHAAKGLEFPITVIAGLGGADAPNAVTGVRWKGTTPLVRLGKMTNAALDELAALERQAGKAEEARLLYVAFTRAKDHLVVSMHHKGGGCPAGRLVEAITSTAATSLATCPEPQLPIAHSPSHVRPLLVDENVEPEELDRTAGQVRRIWTPSGLAKALGDEAGPTSDVDLIQGSLFGVDDEETDDDSVAPGERFGAAVGRHQPDSDDHEATDPGNRKEPGPNDRPSRRGGRFGTAKGSAVHAVMQQVALDEPLRGLPTLVNVASEAEGVLDRRRDIEMMVQSLLKGQLFGRMQASSNCRREMYVGAQFGEITVWGYVDAVFVNPDGTLTLVDFKTDTLITSPLELARRYQPQMSAYVAALQKATGRAVTEAWLAVAQPDGSPAVEIAVDVVEADELLSALAGQPS
jgi:ATP-dependent exoDNAse (exonuclease V) beta subunit